VQTTDGTLKSKVIEIATGSSSSKIGGLYSFSNARQGQRLDQPSTSRNLMEIKQNNIDICRTFIQLNHLLDGILYKKTTYNKNIFATKSSADTLIYFRFTNEDSVWVSAIL
jgi:hypothetical protein